MAAVMAADMATTLVIQCQECQDMTTATTDMMMGITEVVTVGDVVTHILAVVTIAARACITNTALSETE
jgi:hypothetical protein